MFFQHLRIFCDNHLAGQPPDDEGYPESYHHSVCPDFQRQRSFWYRLACWPRQYPLPGIY